MATNQLTSGTLKLSPYSYKLTAIPGSTNYDITATPLLSSTFLGADFYDTFNAFVDVTTFPANLTTLDVYIQMLSENATDWADIYHFTQWTATGNKVYSFRPAGTAEFTTQDGALGAGATNTINLPQKLRVKCVMTNGGAGNMQLAVYLTFFRRRGIGGT
jgi:hypothetical protein